MSAWIVGKTHIDLLVTAGLTFPGQRIQGACLRWWIPGNNPVDSKTLRHENADTVGVMLWAENYRSVMHRYPDAETDGDGVPGPDGFTGAHVLTYEYLRVPGRIDPVVVLKAMDCYEYQSCEHDGWQNSSARAFCAALQATCIGLLPGYDKAPWGFDDRDYFVEGKPCAAH